MILSPVIYAGGKFDKGLFTQQNLFFLIDYRYARELFKISDYECKKGLQNKMNNFHYEDKHENSFRGSQNLWP